MTHCIIYYVTQTVLVPVVSNQYRSVVNVTLHFFFLPSFSIFFYIKATGEACNDAKYHSCTYWEEKEGRVVLSLEVRTVK